MSIHTARVADALRERFESGGDIAVASAPGRVNLVGGHTDYNDGFVLPTAIDRRTVAAARPRTDGRLVAYSRDYDETICVSLEGIGVREGHWSAYVAGVAAALVERDDSFDGASLVIDGGVPMGAGLASSAALEVAVAGALVTAAGIDLVDDALATLCWRAETEYVGVDCGIMDQFAVTLAAADRALFLDCRTRESEQVPLDSSAVRPVVIDTTVQHELMDSAYNERVRQCAAGLDALAVATGDDDLTALRDVSAERFETHADALDPTVRKRCRHVVTENDRVRRVVAALREGAYATAGRSMTRSHESLRDDYEVSCAELDAVVERATAHDSVYGARMTGAGFGGCVVALVDADAADAVAGSLRAECDAVLDATPETYVCRPASGLRTAVRAD